MIKKVFVLTLLGLCGSPSNAQIHYNANPTPSLSGKAFIFFNGSIDTSKALPGNLANGLENLEQRIIDVINGAQASVDVAAYELNSLNIVVALCKARERGVRVRVVFDDEAAPNNNADLWKIVRQLMSRRYNVPMISDAGWPWVRAKSNLYKGRQAQMHDKFIIIDYVTDDPNDDIVITGSYNYTITGMVSMQNIIRIQSKQAAAAYTEEFENMWGSSTDVPDTTRATFHQFKPVLKESPSVIPGKVEAYLAPFNKSKTRPNYLELIADLITREADHDIKVCSFSFSTNIEVDEAIREKFESKNVDVKAVFDNSLGKGKWSLYKAMRQDSASKARWKKRPEAYLAYEDRQLHHKYILIDAENPNSKDVPIVITGSFNFSKNANEANDDNFVVIHDRLIANQYLQEFYARFNNAKKLDKAKAEAAESVSEGD